MLWSLAWRNIRSHRARTALNVVGIALAVGLIFAVLSLSETLVSNFDNLYSSVYGDVSLVISGANGQGTVAASTLSTARRVHGVKAASAQISSLAPIVRNGKAGTAVTDQINTVGVRPSAPDLSGATVATGRRIRSGRDITLNQDFADRHNLSVGDTIKLATSSGVASFKVVGLMKYSGGDQFGGEGYATIPLSRARKLFGVHNGYDEVDVQVGQSASVSDVQHALEQRLPHSVQVAAPAARSGSSDGQLKAFNSILDFFGTMAAFVGAFLVLNSFNMSVAQRMREIGVLRTIGTSRRQITRSILLEALLLSLIGAPLGLAIGFLLAHLMGAIVAAVNYPLGSLRFPAVAFIVAPLAGVAATLLGALRPAIAAGRVPPIRAVLAEHSATPLDRRRRLVLGSVMTILGLIGVYRFAAATSLPIGTLLIGIVGIVLLFGGVVTIAPLVVPVIVRGLSRPIQLITPIEGRLASDSTRSNPRRTAATASGLMIGVALVVTIGALGASLIGSISDQLDRQVKTDFTVQPLNYVQGGAGTKTPMSSDVRRQVSRQKGVERASGVGQLLIPNGFAGTNYQAVGFNPSTRSDFTSVPFIGQTPAQVYAKLQGGEVTIGGQLWRHHKVSAGDTITIKGPRENLHVKVAGVVDGSSLEDQQIGMSEHTFRQLTGVSGYSQIDVLAKSAADRAHVKRELDRLINHSYPNLQVLSNDGIKHQIESQINQVFAIFYAIMLVAVLVSLLGVVNTMMISVLERTRDIGVLRAIGTSRWGVGRMVTDESVLLTVAGAVVGLVVGFLIGYAYVNGVSSGLSGISFRPPVGVSIAVAIVSVLCGLIAAVLPARRAAQMNIIEAISYE